MCVFRGAITGLSGLDPDPLCSDIIDFGRGLACGACSMATSGKSSRFVWWNLGDVGDAIGDAEVDAERFDAEFFGRKIY